VTADQREIARPSARLITAGRAHQDDVRRTAFVVALAARRLPWRAYADWLAQQFFLHESLQQAEFAMSGEQLEWALIRPESGVLTSLAVDLEFLHGPRWMRRIVARPATTTYCTRLRDIAVTQLSGYVAHHLARHAEDLQTGRYLRPAVAAAYGLENAGCCFLTPRDAEPVLFTARYAALIDLAPWSPAASRAIAGETAQAHRMYLEVLKDLARSWA
jgi:heme oxygenase